MSLLTSTTAVGPRETEVSSSLTEVTRTMRTNRHRTRETRDPRRRPGTPSRPLRQRQKYLPTSLRPPWWSDIAIIIYTVISTRGVTPRQTHHCRDVLRPDVEWPVHGPFDTRRGRSGPHWCPGDTVPPGRDGSPGGPSPDPHCVLSVRGLTPNWTFPRTEVGRFLSSRSTSVLFVEITSPS